VDLSVVIPTRDRWDVLEGTLDALQSQAPSGFAWEIVVVNNGPGPSPALEKSAQSVTAIDEPRPGAAAARNAGIAAASADLILFLGDDCRPARPGFLAGHVAAHRSAGDPWLAVVGGIAPDPAVAGTPFMRWLARSGKLIDESGFTGDWRSFYTGNVSLSREALLAAGGFDERFSGYGWEDADLALRLADHGLRLEQRGDLLVHHAHEYDLAASLARMEAVGRGANLLERLHDHRRPLPGPAKSRRRMAAARALGPVAERVPRAWRAQHLAAYARGYDSSPLPDDPAGRGYGRLLPPPGGERPPVSVIVPFLGGRPEGDELTRALAVLERKPGDELIVVDNGAVPVLPGALHAPEQQSSYHARNAGADRAAGDWLLFLDADCRPRPRLIDDYFAELIDPGCGAVAGRVMPLRGQDALVARYARSRGHLSQAAHMRDAHLPYGITANLLIRRAALEQLGGFQEALRSGGDADVCWRLQDAGWTIAYREAAAVEHAHRERVVALARQAARYSAAIAWMERHRPGSSPRPKVTRRLVRAVVGAAAWGLLGRRERAAFKLLDGVVVIAEGAGWLFSNAAPWRGPEPRGGPALVAGAFPDADAPARVPAGAPRVEAERRPARLDRAAARGLRVRYAEDDGFARRAFEAVRTWSTPMRDAPALRRLRTARAEWLAAGAGAEHRADRLARALAVPRAPRAETAATPGTTAQPRTGVPGR